MNAHAIIDAVRKRGSDPRNLRDAAHEAHHALDAKVKGKWDRENIHRYVRRMGNGRAVQSEIMARAVEQIVCARCGVDPGGDIEHWAFLAAMESIKNDRVNIWQIGKLTLADCIKREMESPEAQSAANRVCALAAPATHESESCNV